MHDKIELTPHGVRSKTAAAPTGYVSVLTVDSAKHLLGIGGGYEARGWQIGASPGSRSWLTFRGARRSPGAATDADPGSAGRRDGQRGSYQSRSLLAGLRFARTL